MTTTFSKQNNPENTLAIQHDGLFPRCFAPPNPFQSAWTTQRSTDAIGLSSIPTLSGYRIQRQRRCRQKEEYEQHSYRTGAWTKHELQQFWYGIRFYGFGAWKEIGTILTTR